MDNVIHAILESERRCSERIARAQRLHDEEIRKTVETLDTRKQKETRILIEQSRESYRQEIDTIEEGIRRDLGVLRKRLEALREDEDLCRKAKDRIVPMIFSE
ncbi:MAG: hypothetical protein JXA20_10215 [Spirochaetes bacterium]|nr:hypothetical protein [Spirochaetota bacterium]